MDQETEMSWFSKVPKVELHLHLEGAIPHDALWELIQKYGGDYSVANPESLEKRFEYKDFPHFIETWLWKNQFLREYEDFTFIAEQVARDLSFQNIWYAEVFFSPSDFARFGLETQRLAEAIRKGFSRVSEIEIALVADLVRDFGPERATDTLNELNEVKEYNVVGIGIGGSEQDFPPEPFERVFEMARKFGFYTSAHAGEAAGSESIWAAIRSLKVDRIGHGTRAKEDEFLLDYLAEQKIPLEMCLISNVRTGVVDTVKDHPVREYFDRGIVLSINTDDPKMFGTSLAEEYCLLQEKFDFTKNEICSLILQSVQTSWLSNEKQQNMIKAIDESFVWKNNTSLDN